MPKEKFYDSATDDERRLEVTWVKGENDVAIGTLHKTHAEDNWRLVRVPLDAAQIDDLISTLRRARRQAFGEDILIVNGTVTHAR